MDRNPGEKPDRPLKPVFPPDADVPNPMGFTTAEINDGLDFLVEYHREKARRKPTFPPDADVPNPQGLSTAEINDGLEILAESNREWKRLEAEKAARERPG